MKNKFYSKAILAFSISALLFSAGCKKNETQYGQVGLQLVTQIDSSTVANENQLYSDHNGRLMAISDARFYISGMSVQNTNGTWYSIPNSLLLKIYENQNYNIQVPVPSGNYTALRFYVGLDSVTNASNPIADTASKGIDSVLSATLEPHMYFGVGEGFKFFYFSGYVLPSGSHSPVPVNYQIGGNANRPLVTLSGLNFTVETGRIHNLVVNCDYGKLLQGIQIAVGTHDNGNSFGSAQQMTTATLIADSIPNMFSFSANQ